MLVWYSISITHSAAVHLAFGEIYKYHFYFQNSVNALHWKCINSNLEQNFISDLCRKIADYWNFGETVINSKCYVICSVYSYDNCLLLYLKQCCHFRPQWESGICFSIELLWIYLLYLWDETFCELLLGAFETEFPDCVFFLRCEDFNKKMEKNHFPHLLLQHMRKLKLLK